jgi:drug/metabolite transporter (DMT)-like permease
MAGGGQPGARDLLGGAFIAVAAVLFGGVVILGKSLPPGLPVPSLLAVRFAVAALLLATVQLVRRQPLAAPPGERLRLAGLGAVGYAVESAFFFLALDRGSASAVTLLFFTYPVWVALFSAVLGMGLPGWLVGGSLLSAVAGAVLVVASGGGLDITVTGIALALASALTFSFYLLGADALVSRTPSLVSAMWVSASAALALGAYGLAGGAHRLPEGAREWIPVTAMGVLTAGAFLLLFLGLRRVGAIRAAIIAALEPVATSAMAVTILGEELRPGVAVGGTLILVAAVAASLARPPPETEPVP